MPDAEARIKRAIEASELRVEDTLKQELGGLREKIGKLSEEARDNNKELRHVKVRVTKIEQRLGLSDDGA